MAQREQDDLPYRSPITPTGPSEGVTTNEQDYSTLKIVREALGSALEDLYLNFNAFDVMKDKQPIEAAENLLRQIDGKQIAYDIILPLFDAVNDAMRIVDNRYKEKN